MTREAGTTRERVTKALLARYAADQDEALVKIDALLTGEVVPGHYALTEDIDRLLAKVADAAEKMATLRRHYGTNQAKVPWGVRLACFVGVEKALTRAPESRTMELMEL